MEMDVNVDSPERADDDFSCILVDYRLLENDGIVVGEAVRAESIGLGLDDAFRELNKILVSHCVDGYEKLTTVIAKRDKEKAA